MGSSYAPLFVDFGQDIEILAALLVIVIGTAATIIPTRRRPPYHIRPTGPDHRIVMQGNSFRLHYGCQSNARSIHLLA